jgi:hypothetical protein
MKLIKSLVFISLVLVGCQKKESAQPSEAASDPLSQVPAASSPIAAENGFAHMGVFSNMEFTDEHQYGSEVDLWKAGDKVVGRFSHSAGLAWDTPTGMLQKVIYNEQTGAISFEAKLTMGQHYCKEHKDIPSHDLFQFEGMVGEESLTGVLRLLDGLHGNRISGDEQTVELKRTKGETPIQSYNQWVEQNEIIINFRGPKW